MDYNKNRQNDYNDSNGRKNYRNPKVCDISILERYTKSSGTYRRDRLERQLREQENYAGPSSSYKSAQLKENDYAKKYDDYCPGGRRRRSIKYTGGNCPGGFCPPGISNSKVGYTYRHIF